MERNKIEFWNERAAIKQHPGSDDHILKTIEQRYIFSKIQNGARVLDIGCGDGTTLMEINSKKDIEGYGIDFSKKMIEKAELNTKSNNNLKFSVGSVLDIAQESLGTFDVIYTQRCLINLDTFEEQSKAIYKISNLLKPSGIYIMVEATHDGLNTINAIRNTLDLDVITLPWHNTFFNISDVEKLQNNNFFIREFAHISSTYNFLSRAIYAKLAQQKNEELKYDSEINQLALLLPQEIGTFGPVKGWVWEKRG